jgi:anti-anti-sigma factor
MRLADINFTTRDGAVIARVTGEIDISNAEEVSTAVTDAAPNEALGVVLDLTDVAYLDSAGIQLIYRLTQDLTARGQSLRLVIPDVSPVDDALRLAGIKDRIEVADAVDDAVAALRRDEAPAR